MTRQRLLVLAPTQRAASETFVRANLAGLPFATTAYFGDEMPFHNPWRLAYGVAVALSKLLTRLGLRTLASWPAAVVACSDQAPPAGFVAGGVWLPCRSRDGSGCPRLSADGGSFPWLGFVGMEQVRCAERSLPPFGTGFFPAPS